MPIANRHRICCVALLVSSSVATATQAASLHFILFAETLDATIGTVADYSRGIGWANTIASNTGLELQLHTLASHSLTPPNARQLLEEITPAEDDVVCFVYTGHGANADNSDWPTFTFLTYTGDPYVSFDEVVEILQPKKQRMLLVLSDCCNVSMFGPGRDAPPSEPSGVSALTIANYQRLFMDFRGTIRATAASVGQYSLGNTDGGVFFNTFLDDLQTLADTNAQLTWNILLNTTAADAKEIGAYYISWGTLGDIEPQDAHFVIEQVAAAVPDAPDTAGAADTTSTQDTTSDTGSTDANTPSTGAGCGAIGPGMLALSVMCWGAMLVCRRGRRTIS